MSAVPKPVAAAVDRRDEYACVRCGRSLEVTSGSRHHRRRRAVGGHRVSNLVLLCGSGTTSCHGFVHANPAEAQASGWIVRANGRPTPDPAAFPVKKWTGPEFGLQWCRLDDDGLAWVMSPVEAGRRMRALGVTTEGNGR